MIVIRSTACWTAYSEANFVTNGIASGYLSKTFEIVALLSKVHEFEWSSHICIYLDVKSCVEFNTACTVDNDVQILNEFIFHLGRETEVILR